eukprot:COSAG01_NODE_6963_length_3414_cov_48.521569_3_plen_67_part_00
MVEVSSGHCSVWVSSVHAAMCCCYRSYTDAKMDLAATVAGPGPFITCNSHPKTVLLMQMVQESTDT